MTNDQYFPHDVMAGDNSRLMLLKDIYGMEGYGVYWALLELLRAQDGYALPMHLLKRISKMLGVSCRKLVHIVEDFGLFNIDNEQFSSPGLKKRMKKLDDKRKQMAAKEEEEYVAKTLIMSDGMPSKAIAV